MLLPRMYGIDKEYLIFRNAYFLIINYCYYKLTCSQKSKEIRDHNLEAD